ncbi:MAG: SDR family oxidoreductase [Pseudomonadota bacterium]
MTTLPKTPSFRLDGKTALVAGASSGIGLACAVALAEAGAHVVCAARSADKLAAAVDAMTAAGFSASAVSLDITDLDATASAIAALDRLDVYVNSAGLARHSPGLDTTEDDFDAVADINWKAAHFSSREAARKMIAGGGGGSIITISSQMGHVGGVDRTVYAASKHAVEGMTKAMAIEWGEHGIRVNTICPTFVRTPLTEQTFDNPERVAWITSKIKLGRVGEVEDMMGPVVFLASDASALITGTSILVDGGWTAG